MRKLPLLIAICFLAIVSEAQNKPSLHWEYAAPVFLGANKEELIDHVIAEARNIYINNVGEVIQYQRKYHRKNLKKQHNLDKFLDEMEQIMRKKLEEADGWYNMRWPYYKIDVNRILAYNFDLAVLENVKKNRRDQRNAYIQVKFVNGAVAEIKGYMETRDYYQYNNLPHNEASLKFLKDAITSKMGSIVDIHPYTSKKSIGGKFYTYHSYTFKVEDGKREATIQFIFDPAWTWHERNYKKYAEVHGLYLNQIYITVKSLYAKLGVY